MSPRRVPIVFLGLALPAIVASQQAYKPTAAELLESYKRADEWTNRSRDAVFKATVTAKWTDSAKLYYRNDLSGGRKEFVLVDCVTGSKKPAFDHMRLAEGLTKLLERPIDGSKLPFESIELNSDLSQVTFTISFVGYKCDLNTYEVTKETNGRGNQQQQPPRNTSPDGKWVARIEGGKIIVSPVNGTERVELGKDGSFASYRWAPDSSHIVGFRLIPGDRKEVYLIQSSAPGTTRGQLRSRLYDQPGDKLDTYEIYVFDHLAKTEKKVAIDPITGGGQPWAGPPGIDWWNGGKSFIVDYPIRGYQQYRVDKVDLDSGEVKTLVDEKPSTFVDVTSIMMRLCRSSNEILWRSERDDWGHLYLLDGTSGAVKNQITKGYWVVRSVEWVDEEKRQICFTANGRDNGSESKLPLSATDPYLIRYYIASFDGKDLIELTPGPGTHTIQWSPDRAYYVDSYSRIDSAPVHELRRGKDGSLVTVLEKAEIGELLKRGVKMPEVFVAKGRDGKTDIWGVIIRPSNFDPKKKYPVIENIYAGPHDSFVPKRFFPTLRMQSLAELGFIVVQIDGMGTRNRGKKFHDVAWKNIADAGFPDRILWMKAMAKKYPQADVSRVGVYGTSAGGQNSTGALLFHPEFYKVAVSSCGCHDNRIDKMWWNEQWMGFPVGPHYDEQSNITNANKLQGRLLLMVGELDTNVPPESTIRLCDALIKAKKEFDFVILPGMDHTDGGPYGERKRRDFFVKHLLGVEPPNWNIPTDSK